MKSHEKKFSEILRRGRWFMWIPSSEYAPISAEHLKAMRPAEGPVKSK